jgi:predicted lipoprotein with Yx(FWY)xxD motif
MKNQHIILLVLVVMGMLFLAGCTQQPATPPTTPAATTTATTTATPLPTPLPAAAKPADTIGTANSSLGTILVDAGRKTLYYFAKDVPGNGKSACTGTCAATWPAFPADTITVSSPLDPADFTSITLADGTRQATYYGWPLYYYKGDSKPGDTNGDNVNRIWFVVKPDESVLVAQSPALGMYLTDTSGKTLYYYAADTPGTSTCTGSCLVQFPVFSADPLTLPSSLNYGDFSTLSRADGKKQLAYKGMPLYYYIEDKKPGDALAQKYSNQFFAANISGIAVVSTLGTPPPMTYSGY